MVRNTITQLWIPSVSTSYRVQSRYDKGVKIQPKLADVGADRLDGVGVGGGGGGGPGVSRAPDVGVVVGHSGV